MPGVGRIAMSWTWGMRFAAARVHVCDGMVDPVKDAGAAYTPDVASFIYPAATERRTIVLRFGSIISGTGCKPD